LPQHDIVVQRKNVLILAESNRRELPRNAFGQAFINVVVQPLMLWCSHFGKRFVQSRHSARRLAAPVRARAVPKSIVFTQTMYLAVSPKTALAPVIELASVSNPSTLTSPIVQRTVSMWLGVQLALQPASDYRGKTVAGEKVRFR
jgi:hypothetical protein